MDFLSQINADNVDRVLRDPHTLEGLQTSAKELADYVRTVQQQLADCTGATEAHQRLLEQYHSRLRALEQENEAMRSQYQQSVECQGRLRAHTEHTQDLRTQFDRLQARLLGVLQEHHRGGAATTPATGGPASVPSRGGPAPPVHVVPQPLQPGPVAVKVDRRADPGPPSVVKNSGVGSIRGLW